MPMVRILLLGVELNSCSALHLGEEEVTLPEHLIRRIKVPVELRRQYPEEEWDIGFGPYPNFTQLQPEAEARNLIHTTTIGKATVSLFKLDAALLNQDPDRFFTSA